MSELYVNKILSHTDANNHIEIPSGHTLYAPGHVIQTVIGPEFGTEVSTTSTSFVVIASALAASITPKSTSSKIIVTCNVPNMMLWNSSNDARVQVGISADSGSTFIREFNNRAYDYGASGIQMHYSASFQAVHSPASISQQTYNLYWHVDAGNARINDDQGESNIGVSGTAGALFSQFILQEIAQ
ncbi:MAG: hypothetical protein CMO44_10995 [Verrucomicrobiales bacterium]|nr:hypothetical protein [Verrucomicrobiales bacterium]|tara:strand:- start:5001 stop:5558 length:558 start_codon:yes stop_codon:yes gene_type:complete